MCLGGGGEGTDAQAAEVGSLFLSAWLILNFCLAPKVFIERDEKSSEGLRVQQTGWGKPYCIPWKLSC